jgi:hypothetical protein
LSQPVKSHLILTPAARWSACRVRRGEELRLYISLFILTDFDFVSIQSGRFSRKILNLLDAVEGLETGSKGSKGSKRSKSSVDSHVFFFDFSTLSTTSTF